MGENPVEKENLVMNRGGSAQKASMSRDLVHKMEGLAFTLSDKAEKLSMNVCRWVNNVVGASNFLSEVVS